MHDRFFDYNEHEGRRFANILLSNGPDTRALKINQLLEQESGVNQLVNVIDYLKLECQRRKKLADCQHYKLAMLLSDIDEKSTITSSLSEVDYKDISENKRYKKDSEESFVHKVTEICYSDNHHQAYGIVAKHCDDTPYVWTTYRDNCAAEAKKLADVCQSYKCCEQLMLSLQSIVQAKQIQVKYGV